MKGKVNGKEFAVYGRNAVDGAVTFYIQEYLLKGYGVRLNYRGWTEFCMDMGKDGDKKIITDGIKKEIDSYYEIYGAK